jgi:hypothetical protein
MFAYIYNIGSNNIHFQINIAIWCSKVSVGISPNMSMLQCKISKTYGMNKSWSIVLYIYAAKRSHKAIQLLVRFHLILPTVSTFFRT